MSVPLVRRKPIARHELEEVTKTYIYRRFTVFTHSSPRTTILQLFDDPLLWYDQLGLQEQAEMDRAIAAGDLSLAVPLLLLLSELFENQFRNSHKIASIVKANELQMIIRKPILTRAKLAQRLIA